MTIRHLQHPATAFFFTALLVNAFCARSNSSCRVLETGTVIFSTRDLMACCLPTEKYAILVFRQLLTNIISVPLQHPKGDGYIVSFISFVHASARKAVNCAPPTVARAFVYALLDTVGGYMRTYLLPVTLEGFYAGNVRFNEMYKLHTMYEDIKDYLHTNGKGWRSPLKKYGVSHKVRPLNLSVPNCGDIEFEVCENFLINSESEISEGGSIIPIPFLDDDDEPRSVALPLRYGSLHSIETQESAYLILGHYARSILCLKSKSCTKNLLVDYNKRFRAWLIDSVLPHLQDEKWYPAFGGILRVLRATGENCFLNERKSLSRTRRSIQRRLNENRMNEKLMNILSQKSSEGIHEKYRFRRGDTPQSKQRETHQDEKNTDDNEYNSIEMYEYNKIKMNQNHAPNFFQAFDIKDITSRKRDVVLQNNSGNMRLRKDIHPSYTNNIDSYRVGNRNKKRHSALSRMNELQFHVNNMRTQKNIRADDQNEMSFFAMDTDCYSGEDNLVAIDEAVLRKFKEPFNRDRHAALNIPAPRGPREDKGGNLHSTYDHRAMHTQVSSATEAIEGSIIIGNETTNFTLLRKQEVLKRKDKDRNLSDLSDNQIEKSFHKGHTTKRPFNNEAERENTEPIPKKKILKCGEVLIPPNCEDTSTTVKKKSHRKGVGNECRSGSDKKHMQKDYNKYADDTSMKDESNRSVNGEFVRVPMEQGDSNMTLMTTCFTTCMAIYQIEPITTDKTMNERAHKTCSKCTTYGKPTHKTTEKIVKTPVCCGEKLFALDTNTDVNFDEHENHDKKGFTTSHKSVKISKGIVYHQADKVTTKRPRQNGKRVEHLYETYRVEITETTKHKFRKDHQAPVKKIDERSHKEDKNTLISKYLTKPMTVYSKTSEFTWPTRGARSKAPSTPQSTALSAQPLPAQLSTPPHAAIPHQHAMSPSPPLFMGLFGSSLNGPWVNVTDKCVVRACDGRHAPAPLVPHLLGDVLQSPACNVDFYAYHIIISVILWMLLLCASLGQEDMHCRWRVEARPRQSRRKSTEFDKQTVLSRVGSSSPYYESPTYYSMDGDFPWHHVTGVDPRLLTLGPSYNDKRYKFGPWSEFGTKEERTPLYSSSPKSTSLPTSTCSVVQAVSGNNEIKIDTKKCIQPSVRPPLKFLLHAGNKFKYSSESEPPVSEAEEEHTIDEP